MDELEWGSGNTCCANSSNSCSAVELGAATENIRSFLRILVGSLSAAHLGSSVHIDMSTKRVNSVGLGSFHLAFVKTQVDPSLALGRQPRMGSGSCLRRGCLCI